MARLFVLVLIFLVFSLEGCYVMTLPGVQRGVVGLGADQLDQVFGLGKYKNFLPTTPPPKNQVATVCQDPIQRAFYKGCW